MKKLNVKKGEQIFNEICLDKLPISFNYDGKPYLGVSDLIKNYGKMNSSAIFDEYQASYSFNDEFTIRINAKLNKEFGQCEYTIYFKNCGKEKSKVLSNVACLDMPIECVNPKISGILGDHENRYRPHYCDLKQTQILDVNAITGRASHEVFPYFNFSYNGGGIIFALGWSGTWHFGAYYKGNYSQIKFRNNIFLATILFPDEEISSGLVVMLPYRGKNDDDVMNLWRKWFLKYNVPKKLDGCDLKPFSTTWWSYDTGIPNSDGSISERYYTWKPTLDKILKENLKFDFRWFDAGWYSAPDGSSPTSDWFESVGTWEFDSAKWPNDTFAQSVAECHNHGIKTLVWFEPERVSDVDNLCKNHGYKKEWVFSRGSKTNMLNNIGDEECLKWTTNKIIKVLSENDIDMYREDYNLCEPSLSGYWAEIDKYYSIKANGVLRSGMGEQRCVENHYRLWQNIIDWKIKNGKDPIIDNCAAGGGRLDIKSLRMSIPIMRSDYDRSTVSLKLAMTSTLCKWIPFHGTFLKEVPEGCELEPPKGNTDKYTYRAALLPILNSAEEYTLNKELDYDIIRENMREWKELAPFTLKDFYTLTPYNSYINDFSWTVFAYNDAEKKESILLGFRQINCEEPNCLVKLPYVDKNADYMLVDVDNNTQTIINGNTLSKGLLLSLKEKRSSLLYKIKQI